MCADPFNPCQSVRLSGGSGVNESRMHVAAPHDELLRVAAKAMMDRISITLRMREPRLHLLPHQTGPLGRLLNIISSSFIACMYMLGEYGCKQKHPHKVSRVLQSQQHVT